MYRVTIEYLPRGRDERKKIVATAVLVPTDHDARDQVRDFTCVFDPDSAEGFHTVTPSFDLEHGLWALLLTALEKANLWREETTTDV